jgi:hypothetical protein
MFIKLCQTKTKSMFIKLFRLPSYQLLLIIALLIPDNWDAWHVSVFDTFRTLILQKLVVPFEMRGYQGVYNLEKKVG